MNRPFASVGRRLALCAATLLTAGATVAAIGTAVTPAANAAVTHAARQVVCPVSVVKPHFLLPNHRSLITGGQVLCNVPVTRIRYTITLLKDGRPVKSKTVSKRNTDMLTAFITYRCPTNSTHAYQAVIKGTITVGPGDNVPFKSKSRTVHLRCRG